MDRASSRANDSLGNADARSLVEAFRRTARVDPDAVALRTPGDAQRLTWADYANRVRSIATGLAALGVGKGDTVGLMLVNRPEFNLSDTAALHLGATPFSIYNTSSPEQIAYLFQNAGNRVVVTEAQFVDRVLAARADSPVEIVVCIEDGVDGTIALSELETREAPGFDFETAWQEVGPDDLATLIYTSGTTGPPKGVELTHANLLAQIQMVAARLPPRRGDRIPSYLPHAHIADRWSTHYTQMTHGLQVTCVADPKTVAAALTDIRPTVWGAVPRVWEKIKAALEAAGITNPSALPDQVKAGVLTKIGLDQVRWSCSGAAPIPTEVLQYFADLGLPICELWGMSELSCCATINPRDDIRVGTVGTALPGIELELAEDGELLARGATVMRGYRNMPDKTAETVDADGWLATGDIATIDEDGYVTIVDRKKELIINAAGKNMSPANIESVLKVSSPLIGHAVVIGDRRPYNIALLVLDPDGAAAYARKAGLGDASAESLAADSGVLDHIAAAVAAANERLSRVEQVKRFRVLPLDWEPGGDELTPTLKLKRKPIAQKYASLIEALYGDG